ncbi:hypothetical protein QVD17_18196 [Tagetes erecta]|uniref:BHLH domain-containing protein n=1 Tax=Tagetes erecta TaxID=13708 RepID=A0AAD8KMB1_TARER|nr:hypothetical protein QVD17_18196 [Tagetes erecta]
MNQSFQSLLLTGKYGAGDCNFTPFQSSDDSYLHREMTYLPQYYDKSVLSSLIYPYTSSFEAFDENVNQIANRYEYNNWKCVEMEKKLKKLKTELSTESSSSPSPLLFNFAPTTSFHQLPELQSFEQVDPDLEEKRLKQKFSPVEVAYVEPTSFNLTTNYFNVIPTTSFHQLPELHSFEQTDPDLEQKRLKHKISPVETTSFNLPAKMSTREVATHRRRTLTDKTRSLQNLLPVDRKMDMATIYEEAYKYIKFLKAQINVLESMPVSSTSGSNFRSENPRYGYNLSGTLGKLNRQQLLEILVNSPAAQSTLYSNGCCVYSLEQLMLYNNIAEKSFFIDH